MNPVLFRARLPGREVFPREMPRYPNVFFFVDERLALRGQYFRALRFLNGLLEERLGLRDSFFDEVGNRNLLALVGAPGEGSDWQARIGGLHPYVDPANPALSHLHQLHARFYASPILSSGFERVEAEVRDGKRACLLVPASVHYEVATEETAHPYVDSCPLCGLTGDYAFAIDRNSEDYCLKIHDPLGAEFLLHGTVRGKREPGPNAGRPACLEDLGRDYEVLFEEVGPGPLACELLAGVYVGQK